MGLFFHELEAEYSQYGTQFWEKICPRSQPTLLEGRFCQLSKGKEDRQLTLYLDDQKIYFQTDKGVRSLDLCMTVMEESLYLNNSRKVYSFKLMRDQLITIFYTYKQNDFVNFYCFLAKFCILKNFEKHFKVAKKIGSGAFSHVYQGFNILSQEEVALKVVQKKYLKSESKLRVLKNEIEKLQKLRKYHLSPLIQIYESEDCIILVLQKAEAGNLVNYIQSQGQNYDSCLVKCIMNQIIFNLKNLHEAGFIHRDIKPENILFTNNKINSSLFLADFGLTVAKDEFKQTFIAKTASGTPGFVAPEVLHTDFYDEKCDLFSVGCMFYLLNTGQNFFNDKSIHEITSLTVDCHFIKQRIRDFSFENEEAKDLLERLLEIDPTQRISAKEALTHKYFEPNSNPKSCTGVDDCTFRQFITEKISKFWE